MPSPSPIAPVSPPRLLVSVRDADEAERACAAGADLVDAKDPSRGALGALPAVDVRAILDRVGAAAATSAVAGEKTGEARLAGVTAMAATGVDYVKLALHPASSEWDDTALVALARLAPGRLIAVLFAEDGVPAEAGSRISAAGLRGAMIDTRGKDGRRLTDLLSTEALSAFVASCRANGLLCGLAGSLRVQDIPPLAALRPDYLGFRGGLCVGGDRRNPLDAQRVQAAVQALRSASARRDAA